nr:hypothetical protein [uncultured bacterium]
MTLPISPDAITVQNGATTIDVSRLTEIETAVRRLRIADDVVAVSRRSIYGDVVRVAYAVPLAQGAPPSEIVQQQLRAVLGEDLAPHVWVDVRSIPLTTDGAVDLEALCDVGVLRPADVTRIENDLRAQTGAADLALIEDEAPDATAPLHLSDLLPGWGRRAEAATTTTQAGDRVGEVAEGDDAVGALSYADGGPLMLPPGSPTTLNDGLLQTAATRGDRAIRMLQANGSERVLTYAELLVQARRVLTGLRRLGLRPGDIVVLQVPDLHEYFPTFWACLLGGIKPVTVAVPPSYDARNSVVRKLCNTWQLLGQPRVLATSRLMTPIESLREAAEMGNLQVIPVTDLFADAPASEFHPAKPEDVAFFQLSSGSTGTSKCIQITHRGVVRHIHASQQRLEMTSSDITLNWLPTDHVVPLLMYHAKDVYLGIEAIQVPGPVVLAEPLKWLDLIDQYRVTHTWAPNFGFKMVVDALQGGVDRRWDLTCVKGFVNAGEQVTVPVVRDFIELLAPHGVVPAMMQPAFGMAEACTCMTYETEFSIERSVHRFAKASLSGRLRAAHGDEPTVAFVDCGPVVPGVEIRIADRTNVVVPEATIGRLQIRGDVVTPGYLNNDAANAEAFVGDGWFNSGDLGFMLDGHLTLTGREKELIIINGANFYCYELEDVAADVRGVLPTFVAACGVDDAASGTEALAIFFVADPSANVTVGDIVTNVRTEVATRAGLRPAYVVPVARDEFPKTTSGKIQRGQLKRALLDGRFDGVLKDLDIQAANANTVPHWFFRPVWTRREAITGTEVRSGVRLIFADDHGVADALVAQCSADGAVAVRVARGASFGESHSQAFTIDPAAPEHYARVLDRVIALHGSVDGVIHAWLYDVVPPALDEAALTADIERGVDSVLLLAQALGRAPHVRVPLIVVTVGACVTGPEPHVAPARAMVGALLKSAAAEYPTLAVRHVDFDRVAGLQDASPIQVELTAADSEMTVAYREGKRFVGRLERLALANADAVADPFVTGGVYVITGGLGGVAVEVATHLLSVYRAKLLLSGRHTFTADAAREDVFRRLERLPGAVRYAAVDVADAAAVRAAADAAIAAWERPIDGVLHLAGIFEQRAIDSETPATLAATLRPKVQGTLALHQLVANRPGALFITFSSVNGWFGGFGASGYAAANAFLDAFVHVQRRTVALRAQCVAWTQWDDVGMSRGYGMKAAAQAQGFSIISRARGVQSLQAVAGRDLAHTLVGLSADGRAVRSQVLTAPAGRRFTVYVAGSSASAVREVLAAAERRDAFGVPLTCDVREVSSIPRTATGVDRRALLDIKRGAGAPVAPRTDIERLVAGAWRDVLKLDAVSVHDNFFEIGGTSFLAGQISGRLRAALETDIAGTEMFQFPTIAAQAAFLLGDTSVESALVVNSQSRGTSRRAAMRRLRRPAAGDPRAQS